MVLVAVPFMVLSDNAPVELCLRLLINFQKGLELQVILINSNICRQWPLGAHSRLCLAARL